MPDLKIGLIGLDTSHVPAFTGLLNDSSLPHHIPGARVVAAYPGGSPDFPLSIDRVEGFTNVIREQHGVEILDSPEAVAQAVDAILLTSVDGRKHLELFRAIALHNRPTFIDKPFATSSADARAIADLAAEHGVNIFTCSSVRFAVPFVEALEGLGKANIWGADFSGPMALEPTQPGLFWYGIHSVELLYATFGRGCVSVSATTSDDHELVSGRWADGRIGTVRGNRKGLHSFGALFHTGSQSTFVDAYKHDKPGYACLLEQALPMFRGGPPPIDIEESVEIVRFIEAANQSRESGLPVAL